MFENDRKRTANESDIERAIGLISQAEYYSVNDLRYNIKKGIMMSKDDFEIFLDAKDKLVEKGYESVVKLPLKTFNSKHCFFVDGPYLRYIHDEYKRIFISDREINQSRLFERNTEDMLTSRLFSEIEGTLSIENIPTTQRRIAEVDKCDDPTDKNDIIIKNMLNAMRFIIGEKPTFNKENLRRLYGILSKDCLPDELILKDGAYYRDDRVYIGAYEGADPEIIEECMDSLFEYADNAHYILAHDDLLPFICHYYILYIHPYFDYNGRTARMVSFRLNYICGIESAPYFMSEAINENKSEYYSALTDTRSTGNDLTYFLGYVFETSIKFGFVYKNLEEIRNLLRSDGEDLTPSEWVYVKKILIHAPDCYFNYKMFLSYINASMTRQRAYKILNELCGCDILKSSKNKKGDTVYRLNRELITFEYHK